MKIQLTVLIPTYNRKKRLIQTLLALQNQDCRDFKVVVCDNCSEYDINEIEEFLSPDFIKRISLERNSINIGASANITNLFLKCKTKWCWLLGDDDMPSPDAVSIILRNVASSENVGVFHFPILNIFSNSENSVQFSTLQDWIGFYENLYNSKCGFHNIRGDLIFLSNKVFNLEMCKDLMQYMFIYSHTRISQVIPIIKLLDSHVGLVKYVNERIIQYLPPESDHWNVQSVVQGMANLTFVKIVSINTNERNRLLNILMLNSRYIRACYIKTGNRDVQYLSSVYHMIYKYTTSGKEKLIFCGFILASRSEFTFNILKKIYARKVQ